VSDAPAVDAGILRRHFVAIATGEYEDPAFAGLPVAEEVRELSRWLEDGERLGDRAFARAFPTLSNNPAEDDIRAAFHKPVRPWTGADAAVVFVTGHGVAADETHYLVLHDSESDDLKNTALRTGQLIGWLHRRNGIRHLLLVIDACYAAKLAADTVSLQADLPESWLILPSASKNGEATTGVLTSAITQAVEKLRGGQGRKYGTNRRYFRVSDFIETVQEFAPDQDVVALHRGNPNAEHVCLPNPHYAEPDAVITQPHRHDLALPQADLDTHWAPRAKGTSDGRWLFTGRADLMRELIATVEPTRRNDHDDTRHSAKVTLVTGGAGCGKSAVLARLVTLSDPAFLAAYPIQAADIPADLRPPVGAVDIAVLATGKYPHEVLGQVSAAIGARRPEETQGDADLTSRIVACRATLDARTSVVTMVLDALDEAEDPIGIARMLARLAESPHLRLLVGVRSPAGPDDRLATSGPSGPLADQVERLLSGRRLRVDDDPWWHQGDVRDYAASILRHTPISPYAPPENHDRANQLARVIAKRVGRSFLVARLAATALTQRRDLVDPDDPAWRATLDDGVVGAFRADLRRLFPDTDRRLEAVELLRAVAFAYGRGLPWGEIWPLVANAVADRHGKYGDRDIAALLASGISAYLTTDIEDDVTVYRLFHDALRTTLRDNWHDLLDDPE
jgi:hypothetical protein